MRSATQALLPFVALIVGFAAGTGFGVVVLSGGGGAGVADYDSTPAGARDAPARGGQDSDTDDPKESTRRRGVSTDDVLIENSLRAGGGMPATRGEGVVAGKIHDQLGKPIEGVQVTATTGIYSLAEPPEGLEADDDDSLELRIRRLVWEHRFSEATRTTTATAADGSFSLTGMVDAEYSLEPSLVGWRFTPDGGEWTASPGESRDFTAHPVVGVAVSVRMPDGTVPEGANVWYGLTGSNDSTHYSWSADSDPLELSVGHYTFSANAGEHVEFAVGDVVVEVADDGSAAIELRLEARAGVIGKVEFAGTERPLAVGVAALSLSGGGDVDESHLLTSSNTNWIGDPFEFALLDLEPGAYLLGAVLRNGVVLGSEIVEIADGALEHVFSVGNVDVRDYVVVRPRSPDGSPVGEIRFVVGYAAGDDLSFEGNLTIEPEADGSYRVPLAVPGAPENNYNGWSRSGEVEPGNAYSGATYFVTAQSSRFGQKRVEYSPRADREIDVVFSEPAWAVVTVAGYASTVRRGGIEVMLAPATDGQSGQTTLWLDENQRRMTPQGIARVGPVEPGSYVAKLMILTPQNGYREVSQVEVTLGVGETPLTMSVPDLYDLTMVVDGDPLDLDLHRDPGPLESADFLDEGVMEGQRTVFSTLSPGRYRVRHYGEGSTGDMLVNVPSSGPVRFVPTAYNCLRIEGVPEGLAGLLERGDLVTAIGAHDMDGERRVRAALALAQAEDSVVLTVRRGGRVLEVEVPSAPLENMNYSYWVR